MIDISSILFVSILVGACEMANSAYATTTDRVPLTVECYEKMAVDAVTQLKKTFLPTLTTFWLQSDVVTGHFGHALDQELRKAGFAIVSKPPGIEISYVVDRFGENKDQIEVVVGDESTPNDCYIHVILARSDCSWPPVWSAALAAGRSEAADWGEAAA